MAVCTQARFPRGFPGVTDFTYAELRGGTGVESSNPLLNLVNAGRVAVCGLYNSAPYQFFDGISEAAGDVTGISQGFRKFMDNMCSDRPLPALPEVGAPGGRCPGTLYRVRFGVSANGSEPVDEFQLDQRGPLGPVQLIRNSSLTAMGWAVGPGDVFAPFYGALSGGPNLPAATVNLWRVKRFSITPLNGPDNCGSNIPLDPPRISLPGDYDKDIVYRDRGVDTPTRFRFPPISFPALPGVDINPNLTIDVGGININFDFRGARILPIEINAPINFGSGGQGSYNPLPPKQGELDELKLLLSDRFDRVEDLLEDVKECACDVPPSLQTVPIASGVGSASLLINDPAKNRSCVVVLVNSPTNARSQEGGNAPDVLYAGWAWWSDTQGNLSERFPVDASRKIYDNPGSFLRFHLTLYSGYLANVFSVNQVN
jgi:hypothetical protein